MRHMLRGEGELPMGTHLRTWASDNRMVTLTLYPREEMTWRMLLALGAALRDYVRENPVEFQFLLLADGIQGEVGIGQLSNRWDRVTQS